MKALDFKQMERIEGGAVDCSTGLGWGASLALTGVAIAVATSPIAIGAIGLAAIMGGTGALTGSIMNCLT